MSNSFATTLMPRILAGALEVLREEVAFAKRMNKDYEASAGHIGQQVSVAIPYPAGTYDVTPAAVPPALTDSNFLSRLITINNWKGTRFSFTPKDVVEFDFGNSQYVPKSIAEAARAQARLINQSITALWPKIPNIVGDNDARLFNTTGKLGGLADARERLNFQLCPDNDRSLIFGLEDERDATVLDEIVKNPQMAGDHDVFRKAYLGKIYDIELARDRDIVTSSSAGTITGAVTVSNATKGATTLTLTTVASTGAVALNYGDVFMISDDYNGGNTAAVLRRSYAVADVAGVTIGAGTAGTVTLDHPLEVTLTGGANTITVYPKQGGCRQCIGGNLSGFGLVMRTPPSSIEGAPTIGPSIDMTDPVSGIPMKLTYLPGYHAAQWELSTMWGVDVVDWRQLLRVQSKT
jgi:hypothetical protein